MNDVFMAGCMLTLLVFFGIPFLIFLLGIAFSSPLGFVVVAAAIFFACVIIVGILSG